MKLIQFLGLIIISSINIYGQKDLIDAKIYLKNEKEIDGKVKADFASKTDVKVYIKDKKKTYSKRKIDSILIGKAKYYTNREFLNTEFLRIIEKGTISLFEIDGKSIGIKRNESEIFTIPKSKYNNAYNIFCNYTYDKGLKKINKEKFIKKVRAYNNTNIVSPEKNVLFDSIRNSSEMFLTRLSFLRPEIGFELKVINGVSIYNSLGINIYGDWFRDAQTFVNYDYSGEIRFYYNKEKRLKEGKSNYNFSGPFVASAYKYMIDINRENKSIIGLLHGWQDNNIFKSVYSG